MSGKLTSGVPHIHDFQDDFESTIYILLWVSLMYMKTFNSKNITGFLNTALNPL